MSQKKYSKHYSDGDLHKKVGSLPSSLSSKVVRQVLILYVLLKDPDVPGWAKVAIVAALGYFIFPFDLIPDFLPGGYIDDIAVMAGVVRQLYVYTTPEILEQVDELMPGWTKGK